MSFAFVGSTFSGAISIVPSFFFQTFTSWRIDSQVVFKPVQPVQPRGLFVCSCAGPGCTTPAAPRPPYCRYAGRAGRRREAPRKWMGVGERMIVRGRDRRWMWHEQPPGDLAQLVERTLSMCKVMSSTLIVSKMILSLVERPLSFCWAGRDKPVTAAKQAIVSGSYGFTI
jgi:hypothetical protein